MIVIVNYGLGNVGSILNMLARIGVKAKVSSEIEEIESAAKLILPGVGAFDYGMHRLTETGILPVLNEKVINCKIPILGICLGMQLFAKGSAEGSLKGLGWINGNVVKFDFHSSDTNHKIPHMGWNSVDIINKNTIFSTIGPENRFYFAHSYYVLCNEPQDVLATTNYGYDFPSAIQKENIIGVQFHPEKSHRFGMELLKNFAGLA